MKVLEVGCREERAEAKSVATRAEHSAPMRSRRPEIMGLHDDAERVAQTLVDGMGIVNSGRRS